MELKAVKQLQIVHEAQLLYCLKTTRTGSGLLTTRRHLKAKIKRFVFNLPKGHDA